MKVYDLWLPIVASGLATHVLSTLAWMALPHHKPEIRKFPGEDELLDLLDKQKATPGQYIFPFTMDANERNSEAFKKKQTRSNGSLIIWPNMTNMGVAVALTLAFFMVTAFVIGYLASIALVPGTPFMKVFQFVTTTGLLAHCFAKFPHCFWFRRPVAMDLVDGAAYAIATGLIFASLWPAQ